MPANLSRKNSILRDDDDVHEIFADTRMSRLYFECVNYKNKREHMLALLPWYTRVCAFFGFIDGPEHAMKLANKQTNTPQTSTHSPSSPLTNKQAAAAQTKEFPSLPQTHVQSPRTHTQSQPQSSFEGRKSASNTLTARISCVCVELAVFLQAIYLTFWATQLLPIAAHSTYAPGWILILTLPMVFNLMFIDCVVMKAVLLEAMCVPTHHHTLKSTNKHTKTTSDSIDEIDIDDVFAGTENEKENDVCMLDVDVLLDVFADTLDAEAACLDLRNSIRFVLAAKNIASIRWKAHIQLMCEKYSEKKVVYVDPEEDLEIDPNAHIKRKNSDDSDDLHPAANTHRTISRGATTSNRKKANEGNDDDEENEAKKKAKVATNVHYLTRPGFRRFLESLEIYLDMHTFNILWETIDLDMSDTITWDEIYLVAFPEFRKHFKSYMSIRRRIERGIDHALVDIEQSKGVGVTKSSFVSDCFEYFDPGRRNEHISKENVRIILRNIDVHLTALEESQLFSFVGVSAADTHVSWRCFLAAMDPKNPQIDKIRPRPVLQTVTVAASSLPSGRYAHSMDQNNNNLFDDIFSARSGTGSGDRWTQEAAETEESLFGRMMNFVGW
jgi:hypothetical protein